MSDSRLADELEIRDLVARYSDAVNRGDHAAWAETWSDDGVWRLLGREARGRENCVALLRELTGPLSLVVQLATNGLVRVDGERASGRWSILEHFKTSDGGSMSLGIYDDAYRRERGGWRFAARSFHALYLGPPDLSAAATRYPTGS